MKKEEPVTHFKFSYAELEQLGDRSDELMARDATELAEYGVDATYRSDLAAKTQDLKDFPTDEELLGEAASATEIKDALADKLRVDIRAVMVRAKQVFKEGSAAYNRFGTKGLDTLSDSDLVRCARRVVRMGTLYMAQLAPKGLTPAILAALGAGATSLDDAIDDQDTALRARTVGTQERVELANALYDNIVELFDFGKDHWYTRNETKYNDYVIYDVPGGSGSAPIELTGEIPPMSTVNIKDGIAPKAKITVKNIGTVPFTVCSTDSAAESCTIGQVILPGGEVSFTGGSSGVPLLKPFLNATNNDPLIVAKYNVSIG